MPFPFVSRAHHEEVVRGMKEQIVGLAKLLYPNGVPEEFQLLVGIHIEAQGEKPEPERPLTDDEQAIAEMKADHERDKANLARIKRLRPSQLGPAMANYHQKWGYLKATAAAAPSPA